MVPIYFIKYLCKNSKDQSLNRYQSLAVGGEGLGVMRPGRMV